MPRACKTCAHPQAGEIAKTIARGDSFASVAVRFGVTEASVQRHAVDHLKVTRRGNDGGTTTKRTGAPSSRGKAPEKARFDSSGRCVSCGQLGPEADAALLDAKAIVRRAEGLLARSERIAETAEEQGDLRLVLSSVDRCQRSIETLAKMAGLLAPDNTTVIINEATKVRMTADEAIAAILGEITGEAAQSAFLECLQVCLGVRSELSDRARGILVPVTIEHQPALKPAS